MKSCEVNIFFKCLYCSYSNLFLSLYGTDISIEKTEYVPLEAAGIELQQLQQLQESPHQVAQHVMSHSTISSEQTPLLLSGRGGRGGGGDSSTGSGGSGYDANGGTGSPTL